MRTAETIVKEYLERGFSVEALKLLAETRPEPLCSEMKAVLNSYEGEESVEAWADDVVCAPVSGEASAASELFFVADDEAMAMDGDGGLDFDIMAEVDASAASEESVADIFIGETAGAEMVSLRPPSETLFKPEAPAMEPVMENASVWSGGKPADAAESGESVQDEEVAEPMAEESSPVAEEMVEEPVALSTIEEPQAETLENVQEEVATNDCAAEAETPESAVCMEEEPALEDVAQPEAAELDGDVSPECAEEPETVEQPLLPAVSNMSDHIVADDEDLPSITENSVDYIPGSVMIPYNEESVVAGDESAKEIAENKASLAEAQEILAQTEENEEPAAMAAEGEPAESAMPLVSVAAAQDSADSKAGRKERRRREKAERKKKRGKKGQANSQELPEIILAKAEGTETLMPEEQMQPTVAAAAESTVTGVHSQSEECLDESRLTITASAETSVEEGESNSAGGTVSVIAPDEVLSDLGSETDSAEAAPTPEALEEQTSAPVETAEEEIAEPAAQAAEEEAGEEVSEPAAESESEEPMAAREPQEMAEETASAAPEETDEDASTTDELDADPVIHFPGAVSDEADAEPNLTLVSGDADEEMNLGGDGDHLMIIAGGGIDLRSDAYRLLAEGEEQDMAEEEPAANNVILFRSHLPAYDGDDESESAELSEEPPMLRMLPMTENAAEEAPEPGEVAESAEIAEPAEAAEERETAVAEEAAENEAVAEDKGEEPAASDVAALSDDDRLSLLRAFGGSYSTEEYLDEDDVVAAGKEHVIVSLSTKAEDAARAEAEAAAAQAEIELEYQERLDEFAKRLLEVQAVAAASEGMTRAKEREVADKEAEVAELSERLKTESEKQESLKQIIEATKKEAADKSAELSKQRGLQEEHERLYNEFEDLRRAYNEVVTDVMPELQSERDDLVLTVERQTGERNTLKSALSTTRKRLAAGYSLGAAACVMLVALPIANWLRSGDESKKLAVDHQEASELKSRLDMAERQNVDAEKYLIDLQRQVEIARGEIARLEGMNNGLTRLNDERARELARVRNGGTSSRTTDNLALQGGSQPSGRLHVNEVRDTSGGIGQTVADNRTRRQTQSGPQMAQSNNSNGLRPPAQQQAPARNGNERIQVNNVARVPQDGNRTAQNNNTARGNGSAAANVALKPGEVKATVRAGEGVAQVVYRVLGTRDPEVIAWVIRENQIRKDRRNNPIIHPNQELRLPESGRSTQSASASRR